MWYLLVLLFSGMGDSPSLVLCFHTLPHLPIAMPGPKVSMLKVTMRGMGASQQTQENRGLLPLRKRSSAVWVIGKLLSLLLLIFYYTRYVAICQVV